MEPTEKARFDDLYESHLRALKLRGLSESTIDVYSRAVRRLAEYYDCCPDQLSIKQLQVYFAALVESHSWSTVKVDRNGLQFFWQHVLKLDWQWLGIIKPPQVRALPDILTVAEIEKILAAMRHLGFGILRRSTSSIHGVVRYRVFLLVTYSMGLRLSEALALQVGDIDGQRKMVHIRRGKGHKDRMVPLPDLTYEALRALWSKHHHPYLLFPNARGSLESVCHATTHMDRGGVQAAMKAVVAECGIKKKSLFTRYATPLPRTCLNKV